MVGQNRGIGDEFVVNYIYYLLSHVPSGVREASLAARPEEFSTSQLV